VILLLDLTGDAELSVALHLYRVASGVFESNAMASRRSSSVKDLSQRILVSWCLFVR
jgi:hypothetical protein